MAITVKHKFTSAKADSGDASLIRPSNWNDNHDITLATGKLMGRYTAGTGLVQEVGLATRLEFSAGNIDLSTAVQAQLALIAGKASLDSPIFINNPQAPTKAVTVDDASLATHAAVHDIVAYSEPGFLYGMELSNNSIDAANDIDVAAGVACATQASPVIMRLAAALTKRMDAAWAVGNNAGCLDAGAIATDANYYVFAIHRPDTGITDILVSLSATAPTLPANYTMSRRIGSIIRISSANLGFTQHGDEIQLKIPRLDVDVVNQTAAAVLRLLSVPQGFDVEALLRVRVTNSNAWSMLFTCPDTDDIAPTFSGAGVGDLAGGAGDVDRARLRVRTNTAGQIRCRANINNTELQIVTYGWIDRRGQ